MTMLVLKAVFFSTIPAPRLERLRMVGFGLLDGLRNNSGYIRTGTEKEAPPVSRSIPETRE
jgi:hypothetical protein